MFSEDGQSQDKVWVFHPPQPITRQLYRCDSEFHVQSLYCLYDIGECYLIAHLMGQDTALLEYNSGTGNLKRIARYCARLARNHDRGGQSQNRIERLRQIQIHEYLKGINELMSKHTLTKQYKGIILAGNGPKKDELLKGPLDQRLRALYIGTITCESEVSIADLVPLISGIQSEEINDQWSQFQDLVRTEPDRLTFGREETLTAIREALLERIYVTESSTELEELCRSVGCKIHIMYQVQQYPGADTEVLRTCSMCGVRWYAQEN